MIMPYFVTYFEYSEITEQDFLTTKTEGQKDANKLGLGSVNWIHRSKQDNMKDSSE
jgi:hypothetical protein